MNTSNPIAIFKTGRHSDMNGTTLVITDADLERTVAAYDPARWKAPLVIGHPRHDAPAWGWVASLALDQGTLLATLNDLSQEMITLVTEGHYRNVSASFYTPDSSSNPVPGVFYLRHVGMLGAQPPAVKGLPQVSFQESTSASTLVMGETQITPKEWSTVASTMILYTEKKMAEIDEKTALALQQAQLLLKEEELATRAAQFAEQTADIAQREAALRQSENDLQRQRTAEFVDALIADGKILPRFRDGLIAFMTFLTESGIVEFAENQPQMGFIKEFLKELPKQVDYAERTPGTSNDQNSIHFKIPEGYSADPVGLEMHGKILAWANTHKTDYLTAALAVSQ